MIRLKSSTATYRISALKSGFPEHPLSTGDGGRHNRRVGDAPRQNRVKKRKPSPLLGEGERGVFG